MFNENDVLRTTTVLTIVLGLAGAVWSLSIGLGIFLGGLMSTLALRLLIIDGTKLLQRAKTGHVDKKGAVRYNFSAFLKRCALYSAALIVASLNPYLNFLATLAGLLLPRLAIIYHLFRGRTNSGT